MGLTEEEEEEGEREEEEEEGEREEGEEEQQMLRHMAHIPPSCFCQLNRIPVAFHWHPVPPHQRPLSPINAQSIFAIRCNVSKQHPCALSHFSETLGWFFLLGWVFVFQISCLNGN